MLIRINYDSRDLQVINELFMNNSIFPLGFPKEIDDGKMTNVYKANINNLNSLDHLMLILESQGISVSLKEE